MMAICYDGARGKSCWESAAGRSEKLMKHSAAFLKLVEDAKTRIGELTVEDVWRKQGRGQSFEFVDVREDNEWAQGYAAGARHIGRGVLERDIEDLVPDRDREIVLYCGGGFRSALAADNFPEGSFRNW